MDFFSLLHLALELTPSTRRHASFHASGAERCDLMSCLRFVNRHYLKQMLLLFGIPVKVTHGKGEDTHRHTHTHLKFEQFCFLASPWAPS